MGSAKNRSYAKRRRAASIGDDGCNASIGLSKYSCRGKTPVPGRGALLDAFVGKDSGCLVAVFSTKPLGFH
jgi:hypothetical protein